MDMRATTLIARSPRDVFAFASDVTNDVHWRTGVTKAGLTTRPPLGVGSEGYDRAGKAITTWKVVAFEPSSIVDWVLTSGPYGGTGGYHVQPDGDKTRYTLVADVEPKGMYRLLGPLFQRMGRKQNQTDVERLKELLEAQP